MWGCSLYHIVPKIFQMLKLLTHISRCARILNMLVMWNKTVCVTFRDDLALFSIKVKSIFCRNFCVFFYWQINRHIFTSIAMQLQKFFTFFVESNNKFPHKWMRSHASILSMCPSKYIRENRSIQSQACMTIYLYNSLSCILPPQ